MLKYVDSNPQEAFPKLLDWADKFDKDNLYLTQRQQIRKVMEQPDSNWMRLINSLWTDIVLKSAKCSSAILLSMHLS